MKKVTRFVLMVALLAISGWGFSQTTIDFETVGNSWSWTAFANGAGGSDNPAGLTCPVTNPATTGINASANCLKFVEASTAAEWGGLYTLNVGTVTITEATKIVKAMVYKSRLSAFTLKLEGLDFGGGTEIPGANTVINEWQEISFDLTAHVGKKFNKLTFLPDFAARTSEVTIYIDNIVMPTVTIPVVTAPATVVTPTVAAGSSIFVYSSNYTYTPFAGLELNPDWGQVSMGTVYAPYPVGDKNVLSYLPLAYQGMAFDNAKQDVTAMKYMHFDIWTADASATPFRVYLIGTVGDNFVDSDIATDGSGWVSLDIPLSKFADGGVGLNSIRQLKFQCAEWTVNGATSNKDLFPKIYIDNIYFWTDETPSIVLTPSSLNIAATASNTNTFDIATTLDWSLASDQTWLTASSASGTGNATITLTATANPSMAVRTANVTVTGSDATVKTVVVTQAGAAVSDAPTPTVDALKVIAIFSDAYTPVVSEFQNWYGTDMVEESSITPANKVKKVSSICCFGYGAFTSNDISSMTTLHVDIYPTTLASLNIGIVSNIDNKAFKTLTPNQWNSLDIPLSDYPAANLTAVTQIGFWDLNGAFYMDNLYFYNTSGMVSLRDNKSSDKIKLYPNPVKSNLFVDGLPQNATVKIYDMKGKLVVNKQNGENQIDVNNLSKGIYSIQISGKNGITTKKFVKE
ncbi:MAG: T9SS type A sorting domain-containing protein [Bacteroidales bacterium]|nr:T9SS type A sorting domain-containing protein [Bacteroidales bacterium]